MFCRYSLTTGLQLFVLQQFIFEPGVHDVAQPEFMLFPICWVYKVEKKLSLRKFYNF